MSLVIAARVLLKIICVFVYGIVGQVHIEIAQIGANWWHIARCRKSGQTLLVYEDSQRAKRRYKNVSAQVKFKSINQVGLMKVALADVMLILLNPIMVSCKENTFALTGIFRFNDKRFGFALIKLLLERFQITWQQPCFWEELIVFRKVLLHRQQIFSKQILPGHRLHGWKVVNSLVWLHLCEKLGHDRPIYEPDVPVFFLLSCGLKITRLCHIVYYFVLGVGDVDGQRFLVAFLG